MSATRKIIIEVEIIVGEPEEDGYQELSTGSITVRPRALTQDQVDTLAEMWGQSDWFWGEFNSAVLGAM